MSRVRYLVITFILSLILDLLPLESSLKVGIMCAVPEELNVITKHVVCPTIDTTGMRDYFCGDLWGMKSVIAISRVGKVAAATTATHLIESEKVDIIIFVGVAGAIDPRLSEGDVVVGSTMIQYDLDSILDIKGISSHPILVDLSLHAAKDFIQFHRPSCYVYDGLIGTADHFVTTPEAKRSLRSTFPSILCVDMEGASVAQVCDEHNTPFVVIKTISEGCDTNLAPIYSKEILKRLYAYLNGMSLKMLHQ